MGWVDDVIKDDEFNVVYQVFILSATFKFGVRHFSAHSY